MGLFIIHNGNPKFQSRDGSFSGLGTAVETGAISHAELDKLGWHLENFLI